MGRNEPGTGEESGKVSFPTGVPRQEVLEKEGQGLALRLPDDRKSKESMLINCLNEDVQKHALELEGLELKDHDGRIMGKLPVKPFRSTSLTLPENIRFVDVFVWGEYDLGKKAPKEEHQESWRQQLHHQVPQINTTTSTTGRKFRKRKQRTVTKSGHKSTLSSSPTGKTFGFFRGSVLCLPKAWQSLQPLLLQMGNLERN